MEARGVFARRAEGQQRQALVAAYARRRQGEWRAPLSEPFKTLDDLSTANEAYFVRCDRMIELAAKYDLLVILDPCETIDHLNLMLKEGATKCRTYGQYLGNRYKKFDNILWMSGNDFGSWRDAKSDAVVTAVALGIKDKDPAGRPQQGPRFGWLYRTVARNTFGGGAARRSRTCCQATGLASCSRCNRHRSSAPATPVPGGEESELPFNEAVARAVEYWMAVSKMIPLWRKVKTSVMKSVDMRQEYICAPTL